MNEDGHLSDLYDGRYEYNDADGDEECEECDELLEDCRCCPDCGSADCNWDCEEE